MDEFSGRVAVITGAGSGFGREFARTAADLGMRVALADIEPEALEATRAELAERGVEVIAEQVDVARGADVERLAERTMRAFGAVHLLFNNAGVAHGGLLWEHSERDWQWVLGVNLWGVIHGVRVFTPLMLAHGEPAHIVNTASVAGLLAPQTMGIYCVSKHGVVALSESLYQDLRVVGARIGVTVVCPAFVPTGIHRSERNRPADLAEAAGPTASQLAAQRATEKAVGSGKLSAADVARMTFDAVREGRFYLVTHPKIMTSVELRLQDVVQLRNPSDPFAFKQDVAFKAG